MKTRKRRLRRKLSAFVVVTIGMLAAFAGVAAARYMMQQTSQNIIAAQDFYFTSDFLKEEKENALYYMDPKMPITIHLYNTEDSLRMTSGEIHYSVEVTGASYTDSGSGKIAVSANPGVSDLVVTPEETAKSVTVTVTSSTPYKKVLTAEFRIEKGNEVLIEDASGNRAAVLTMTCVDAAKIISITLPDGVIPDETNDNVISFDTAKRECRFHSPGYGIYSLILLKSDPAQELTVESGTAFAGYLTINSKNSK